jgi:hypothetical protein
MKTFRDWYGAVYILENSEAQRVKVGMTINEPAARLRALNDLWLGRKGTCQVCGGRLLVIEGRVSGHVGSSVSRHFASSDSEYVGNRGSRYVGRGMSCPGGNAPPLEKDVAFAEAQLLMLRGRLSELSSHERGSATREIKTLERRIELHRRRDRVSGGWRLRAAFYTQQAERVELLSHEILQDRLDESAPIGEIFSCSVEDAIEAVESALSQLELLQSARRELPA